jgi:hypothetical protein
MRITLFVFLLASFWGRSQDTVRVYFEFGSARVDAEAGSILVALSTKFDLSELDSVQFIGYADSVGNLKSNLKLSKRRAKNAYKYCKKVLNNDVGISLFARGEGINEDPSLNRRVELILHFPLPIVDAPDEVIENIDPRCFFIDYEALAYCNVRTIENKKKKYTYIEAVNDPLISDTLHYYVSKNLKGAVIIKKMKWKTKKTGILWWKKTRLVTSIKGSGFDKYKMFTLADTPCDGCKESVFTEDTIFRKITYYYPDYFLMDNMQAKARFFGRDQVKIRVPREYVDVKETYYTGGSAHKEDREGEVVWMEKRGKRRRNYYFTRVNANGGQIPYLKTAVQTIRCENARPPGRRRRYCRDYPSWGIEFQMNVELGAFHHNDTTTGFVIAGLSAHNERSNIYLQGGVNTRGGFYGTAKYDFHFLTIPLASLSPRNSWKTPSSVPYNFNNMGRIYIGTEIRTSYSKDYMSFLESNVHLGFSYVNMKIKRYLPQIYIHGGIARDLANRINPGFYPYVQLGVTVNVFNIRTK